MLNIAGKIFQRVVFGIYGPNNFVERLKHIARGFGNGGDLTFQFFRPAVFADGIFAQVGNAA